MKPSILSSAVASLALVATLTTATMQPARADGAASTRLIAGAAAAAAIVTAVNVQNKHRVANTVVGYLPDGSQVYQDGHVVSQNGQSWYPSNYGQQVACNGNQCYVNGSNNGYYNGSGYNSGYNNNGYNNNGYYNNGYNSNGYNRNYNGSGYYNNGNNSDRDGDSDSSSHRRHHGQ